MEVALYVQLTLILRHNNKENQPTHDARKDDITDFQMTAVVLLTSLSHGPTTTHCNEG